MIQKEEIAMKTDAELQQHVMDELKWEPTIQAAEIGVAVKDGVVTLSGSGDRCGKKGSGDVCVYSQKHHAENLVRHLMGVVGVTNSITIKPPVPAVKALEVKNTIED